MADLFTASVHPGQALGFLVLGASLHDVLTRLKAEAQLFSKLDLIYDQEHPVTEPVVVNLPNNGIRLRFDGAEQRLRLIEVLDFTKCHLTYQNKDVFRHATHAQADTSEERAYGPTFRHIQRSLVGPAFPGEYIPPSDEQSGLYIMSYNGFAFSFPVDNDAWKSKQDTTALLSSSTSSPAVSMAIFPGELWPNARDHIFTTGLNPREFHKTNQKNRDSVPEEVCVVNIHGAGKLEFVRQTGLPPYFVQLGLTTPQDLVASLGPPDAIYRKNDKRMSIHQTRPAFRSHNRGYSGSRIRDDSTDTDVSSAHTITDDSDEAEESTDVAGNISGECFYNYFYHGFDVLISAPTDPSQMPPSQLDRRARDASVSIIPTDMSRAVATKVILHGNVPGSYPFNRHRRCRWQVEYLTADSHDAQINSETAFPAIEQALFHEWKGIYKNEAEAKDRQKAMPLNRDWGNSPESSIELMGGWEESVGGRRLHSNEDGDIRTLGSTELFGFPGLLFEVLNHRTVSSLTVF